MPWRGHNGQWCRGCDRHVSECGPLSARYRCEDCGNGAMLENRRQLQEHSGPYFARFRRSMIAAFGGVLLEDLEDDEEAA